MSFPVVAAAYSALRGIGPEPEILLPASYDGRVNLIPVVSYYKLNSTLSLADQKGVINGGAVDGDLQDSQPTLAQFDNVGATCIGFPGFVQPTRCAIGYHAAHKTASGGISILVQTDGFTAKQIVVASDAQNSPGGWSLEILATPAGQVRFFMRDANNFVRELLSTTNLVKGVAYHLAATWGLAGLRLYVNGVLEDSDGSTAGANNNTTSETSIGAWHSDGGSPLDAEPVAPTTVVNVSTSGTNSGLTFINNIPADRTIQFADGIYDLGGAIVPKTDQYYRGNLTNPAAVELRGTGNFRAFYGVGALAPGCVIKSMKITGYDCGMGRAFVPNPTGDNQDGRATLGAIEQASGWQILDCHVMNNYCSGMTIGNGTRVARCLINGNGHKGIGGGTENNNCRGRNLVVEDNQIDGNCRFDMNKTWDSGGIKVIGGSTPGSPPANPALEPARNNVFRRNRISNNNGPGIWWDWDVLDGEIANNSIFLNHASGIVIEASATAHIHHNQIGDNCTGPLPALVTFRANTVGVQNSKRCLIEDNLFYVNREHASALTQHNRASVDPEIPGSLNTPKGGIYVGWFTGVENEWSGNVWLMQTNGSFTAQLDNHSCSNSNPSCTGVSCSQMCGTSQTGCVITSAPSGPTIGGNFMCFIPQAADNHFNVQDGDTFRIASGTANKWSFHTNSTQITGSLTAFVPNWDIVPSWTTPPGKT